MYSSHTVSTTCKPTILHYCPICQKYSQHFSQMFFTDQEIFRCQYALKTCPSVWILTTALSAAAATITLICLGETTQFIEVKRHIHILHLPTAFSATSPNFHLPPCYEGPPLEVNISLDMANLNMINISSVNFHIWQHLEKY